MSSVGDVMETMVGRKHSESKLLLKLINIEKTQQQLSYIDFKNMQLKVDRAKLMPRLVVKQQARINPLLTKKLQVLNLPNRFLE
jgi:hypothetical protein